MAENVLKSIDKYSNEISEISGDTVVTLPLLGDTTLAKLITYLPLYIQLTKKKNIRDAIPKELHDAILAFAEASGAYEPPPKKQTLSELDIPAREVAQMVKRLEKKGWSQGQIAVQMDLPRATIGRLQDGIYSHRNFIMKQWDKMREWIQKTQPEEDVNIKNEQESHSNQSL